MASRLFSHSRCNSREVRLERTTGRLVEFAMQLDRIRRSTLQKRSKRANTLLRSGLTRAVTALADSLTTSLSPIFANAQLVTLSSVKTFIRTMKLILRYFNAINAGDRVFKCFYNCSKIIMGVEVAVNLIDLGSFVE